MKKTLTFQGDLLSRPQQLRQLGEVRRDPPRLVAREQLSRRSSARLVLEIDVGERLPASVAHDEAIRGFLRLTRAAGTGGRPMSLPRIPRWRELVFFDYALVWLIGVFDPILKFVSSRRQELHDLIDSARVVAEGKHTMHVLADPKFVVAHAISTRRLGRPFKGTD